MPGLFDILEDVAADPAVDSSVEKLVGGLFSHLKELLSQGSAAAIDQVLNDGIENTDKIVAAVTANTPNAPPAPEPQAADPAPEPQGDEQQGEGEDTTTGGAAA